jgi:hypothetical protein
MLVMRGSQPRPTRMAGGTSDLRHVGSNAANSWLDERGLGTPQIKRWHAELSMSTLDAPAPPQFDERTDTRFHIDIYAEEWGFFFCHDGKTSWIRVTDIPFVHGRDEFSLLAQVPSLGDIGALVRGLENQHRVMFRRKHAMVRTNVAGAEVPIRRWIETF